MSNSHTLSYQGQTIVASCAGYETPLQHHDYLYAVDQINRLYDVGLDDTDTKLLGLLMTSLARTSRYGGDHRVENVKKENTAIHTLQSLNDLRRVFESATLITEHPDGAEIMAPRVLGQPGQYVQELLDREGNPAAPYAFEVREMFQTAARGMLIHDCGEMLGEFDTAYQKAHGMNKVEKHEMERLILRHSLILAMQAIEQDDPARFTDRIAHMRQEAEIQPNGVPNGQQVEIEKLRAILGPDPVISESSMQRVQHWLEVWDTVEEKKLPQKPEYTVSFSQEERAFFRTLVKTVEHNQGNRHLLRYGARDKRLADGVISDAKETLGESTQKRALYALRHAEKDLPELFESACSPVARALARSTAALVYESNRMFLRDHNPALFHLERDRPEGHAVAVHDGSTAEPLVALPDADTLNTFQMRLALRARGAVEDLYKEAAYKVRSGDFVPPPITTSAEDAPQPRLNGDTIVTLLEHHLADTPAVRNALGEFGHRNPVMAPRDETGFAGRLAATSAAEPSRGC